MSHNDLIHLQANFQNWVESRAAELPEIDPFVYYGVEQFLKPYDLNDDEICYGITDGGNDGGVDAIYFIANRDVLVRDDIEVSLAGVSKVRLVIMQVKSSGGFSPVEINKLYFFTDDLLDLSRPASDFKTKYNPRLLEIMQTFKDKYLMIAGRFPSVSVDYYYITKGDEVKSDAKAQEAVDQLYGKVKEHLNKATFEFHFVNAQALLEEVMKRPRRERMLVWAEPPLQLEEGYVGLVKLRDFFSFLKDEEGALAERIFESNVRGFQQDTTVNRQIRESLRSDDQPNFWLLNNGITIIATNLQNAGHKRSNLDDPQIVNGLQTSREIFSYFTEDKPTGDDRAILVRVIVTADAVVSDAVVKATNSQNKMPPASLRATDPIHHRIEDLFKQYGYFYDRRKGFYKDKGKPISKIISVPFLLQAVLSVLLQRPDDARARPSDYIKDDDKYRQVFGLDAFPLGLYLTCVLLLIRVEAYLRSKDVPYEHRRNIKFYIASYLASSLTEQPAPTCENLQKANLNRIDDAMLEDCYTRVTNKYIDLGGDDMVAKGTSLLRRMKTDLTRRFGKKPPKTVATTT